MQVSKKKRYGSQKGGSSRNGRNSAGQRLGVKVYSRNRALWQYLVRQRTRIKAGRNVGVGKDDTPPPPMGW
jgi:large subunit ribosomal protein L27